ncbi:ferredoxin reductase [Pseudomonas sp. NCCP-436]|uniref:ferredoxin reductase n=1 Tax=Pseudomonas sp. NCCP-436 TaxID=2842481 RepID=UPI001C823C6C|nr:ferredoxin reductase [Pseudomonas sp. NCCP-436]
MSLVSLSLARRLQFGLSPLRYLCSHGWLREADADLFLRLMHPLLAVQRVRALVESRRWVAEDMLAVTLFCNSNARGWRPGQHVQLFLELDGVRHVRCYSLVRADADGRIELAIKREPGGRLSPLLQDRLQPGDVLELAAARGELLWPQGHEAVLLLAAGSGITPLLGLLREALKHGFSAPVTLLYQVRRRAQWAYVEELLALAARHRNLQLHWAVTGEPAWEGEYAGRLDEARLSSLPGTHLLACGPRGFVEPLDQWWRAAGRGGSVQVESFSPPPQLPAEGAEVVRLAFARSRLQVPGSSALSLLEQAEASGLRPAHGCRQGVCTSCTCLLLAGSVRDLRSGAVFAEPGQPIRLCVSAPHGDVEIDL